MATTQSVIYRKIDPRKISFFDLPVEVREEVHKAYFARQKRLTIHLVQEPRDRAHNIQRGRVSSEHHGHLLPQDELDTMFDVWDTDDEPCSVEELLAIPHQTNLVWTKLESAVKAIKAEASQCDYSQTHFRILGGETESAYHSNLIIVPQRLLSKIKNLVLDDSTLNQTFSIGGEGWSRGVWPVLITAMVSLQNLCFVDISPHKMCVIRRLFTTKEVCYLAARPKVSCEVSVSSLGYTGWWPSLRDPDPALSTLASRFIVPRLKTITFRTCADRSFCSLDKTTLPTIDTVSWHGSSLKFVRSTPLPYPNSAELRTYALAWDQSPASVWTGF